MQKNIRRVTHVQNIRYDKDAERLYIIDQTLLPNEEREIELRTLEEMVEAIKKTPHPWRTGHRDLRRILYVCAGPRNRRQRQRNALSEIAD